MYLEEIYRTTTSGVTLLLFAFALLLLALRGRQRGPGCSFPPGPRPWPLVGNLFQIGEQIHLSLTNLRVQYGDVFQMQMGSLVVVVLSGYSTIKEALVRQGEAFAGRPDLFTFSAVANGTSMTFSEKYGEAWVLHKKICRNALRTFSQAEPRDSSASCLLEERICTEAMEMVEALKEQGEKNCIRDITDALIAMCEDRQEDEETAMLSNSQIVHSVIDIFGAGFDTIITGLQWSLLYLIKFPDIQAKILQEIDNQVGMNRFPQFKDKPNMPYTEAFIFEVFRHASYMPFTIPHCTTENITLNGYFIPKDTCVFINQYQVNHDMDIWGDPEAFRPERFLTLSGHLNKNVTEKVMIFGMGIRRCLGDSFARLEMFVFLTTLLHRLHIENIPGQELDLSSTFGLTMKPRPFRIKISPRN
ncbi:cytochrome P450 1D1 isoform X2 [Chanodichthys erythropterus]|uniref:cytochrome P450 1D1 isoform X2 n=1 Tax=Chanodichthys erythropterus TaxID=933992 RepID=UPI00351EFBB9